MFKKSSESGQLKTFTFPKFSFSDNSLKMYEDKQAWHNQFRKQQVIETLQKRNNVEIPIFYLGCNYSYADSRYKGEIKYQMWTDIGCLWVNFVRMLNYIIQLCQRILFPVKQLVKSLIFELYFTIELFLSAILPLNLSGSENT